MLSTKLRSLAVELDLQHCRNCGGDLKIIATILEQPAEHATQAYEQGRHAPTTGPALRGAHRN